MTKKILFNNLKIRKLFRKMRETHLEKSDEKILRPPQPGLLLGSKYFLIAQNPGIPRPKENPTDKILLDENSDDEDFHNAYKESQFNWKFYKMFIKPLIGESQDFSILNICFYPTKNNFPPTEKAVNFCKKYIFEMIDLINPKIIIAVGAFPKYELQKNEIRKKYKIIYSHHYAYLLRRGILEKEIKKIKEELKKIK